MEELQDALEDAQYVNAINLDEGPRPITAWEKPAEEEMEKWQTNLTKVWHDNKCTTPEPFGYEWVLATSLGFFMFAGFIKESSEDYVQINFIEEILRWRYLRGRSRGSKLRKMYEKYLMPCEEVDPETNERVKPKLMHIDEYDLEYVRTGVKLSEEELRKLIGDHLDDACTKCAIGIDGPVRDEVLKEIGACVPDDADLLAHGSDDLSAYTSQSSGQHANERNPASEQEQDQANGEEESAPVSPREMDEGEQKRFLRSLALSKAPSSLFDKLEEIILECIRLKHWEAFKESPDWVKLIDYLWHRDRKIVDEDFFLMRVLGRGGFGLVTGKSRSLRACCNFCTLFYVFCILTFSHRN